MLGRVIVPAAVGVILSGSAAAQPESAYTAPVIDGETAVQHCTMVTLTSGAGGHTHAYPTARTWHRNNRQVIVDLAGLGPDGEHHENVRYLVLIDIHTLQRTYLATNEHPEAGVPAAGFMFDYAPAANLIAYAGPESKRIYTLNLDNGVRKMIYELPDEGWIGGPLSLAWDGTMLAWWTQIDVNETQFLAPWITSIMCQQLDPISDKVKGKPRLVECFPGRKVSQWADGSGSWTHVNHPQINPRNRDHICYAHDTRGRGSAAYDTGDRTLGLRLWQVMSDGTDNRYLSFQGGTHEVIAPDGRSIIFPYHQGVGEIVFDTGEARSLYYNPRCCPGHVTISPDGRFIAGDTWNRWLDEEGRVYQSIMMFERATRRCIHLCWFKYSHPHAIFSQDGTKIAFSYMDDDDNQQVACIDISRVIDNWDDVYEDVGLASGPGWTVE